MLPPRPGRNISVTIETELLTRNLKHRRRTSDYKSHHESLEVKLHVFWISALEYDQLRAPPVLAQKNPLYPLNRKLGRSRALLDMVKKLEVPGGDEIRIAVVQTVISYFSDLRNRVSE